MGMIMIKCPKTGLPAPTGMKMSQALFDNAEIEGNTFGPCPHCGESHTWSKTDAYVEE